MTTHHQRIEVVPGFPSPELLQSYLLNVAEALRQTLIPALLGTQRARAEDCVRILARLANQPVALRG